MRKRDEIVEKIIESEFGRDAWNPAWGNYEVTDIERAVVKTLEYVASHLDEYTEDELALQAIVRNMLINITGNAR